MKLIIAIISNDDSYDVLSELTKAGLEILRENSSRRTQLMTAAPAYNAESFVTLPVQVAVGGATVFVVNMDKFYKL